jgi:hypothetical protein
MTKVHGFHKSGTTFFAGLNRCLLFNNKEDSIVTIIRGLVNNYEENTKYVIHIRNPIDLLVSAFYSFGYTHEYDGTYEYSLFLEQRSMIQNIGIDSYCIEYFKFTILPLHLELFKWLEIYRTKPNVFISCYEKMKKNFSEYIIELGNFLEFDNDTINTLYSELKTINDFQPVDNKDIINGTVNVHCRNGTSQQYLTELREETTEYLITEMNKNIPEFMKTYAEFNL